MSATAQRVSYAFLCIVPILAAGLTAVRPLRVPYVYSSVGVAHFAAICVAAWTLGAKTIRAGADDRRRLGVISVMLLVPFALFALLWVGIGTPWDATPIENRMRYLVLLNGSVAVAGAFVLLKDVLGEAGERFYSTIGFTTNIFAGAAYVVWLCFQVGIYDVKVRDQQVPPAIVSMSDMFDILLFVACILTYLTTAAFAASLGRVRWLRRGATRAYLAVSLTATFLVITRGLSFPDPTAGPSPWYTRPGFVAGIPAVPWIMPFLLGVVLLRRAGREARSSA